MAVVAEIGPEAGSGSERVDERLVRLLGGPETAWLLDRLRDRLSRGRLLSGTLTLAAATPGQRRAVEALLGRPARHGASLSVPLAELSAVLSRSGIAASLAAAVEALTGPVPDRVGDRLVAEAAWQAAFAVADEIARARPALVDWYDLVVGRGLLRRLARGDPATARQLVEQTRAVLDRLPAGGVPVPVLAAGTVGDGHALDPGRPLATLVLRAAAATSDVPPGEGGSWRRRVWASVGALSGELSTPVLTLGLPGDEGSVTGRLLEVARAAGQPLHLSARALVRTGPSWPPGLVVFVCENPSVVLAAADQLGAGCPPLVCLGGQPSGAATILLDQLAAARGQLRYHGDFDWGGLRIANWVIRRTGAVPWRYDAAAYTTAVTAAPGRSLSGAPTDASWDPRLCPAMCAHQRRVEEEQVLDDLIVDLSRD